MGVCEESLSCSGASKSRCMLSQHHAIGLQTGCMVVLLAPVVEAARVPRVCPMALGYGLPPCKNNNDNASKS